MQLFWLWNYFSCGTETPLILPTLAPQLFWLQILNRPYFGNTGNVAILVVKPELPLFCWCWSRSYFGCVTGTRATQEMQLFWFRNRNHPYFPSVGAAVILVAEPEPPLFCRRWRRSYFGCETGTARILPTLEPQQFWLRNRNCPFFADYGDTAILVVEPELPLFCWLWSRRYFGWRTRTALILPLLCWSRNYFFCGTGTALIFPIVEMLLFWLRNRNRSFLPTLETLPFWLWNRNSPYFADSGDAAILVTEQELPLFCRLLETAPTATLFQT